MREIIENGPHFSNDRRGFDDTDNINRRYDNRRRRSERDVMRDDHHDRIGEMRRYDRAERSDVPITNGGDFIMRNDSNNTSNRRHHHQHPSHSQQERIDRVPSRSTANSDSRYSFEYDHTVDGRRYDGPQYLERSHDGITARIFEDDRMNHHRVGGREGVEGHHRRISSLNDDSYDDFVMYGNNANATRDRDHHRNMRHDIHNSNSYSQRDIHIGRSYSEDYAQERRNRTSDHYRAARRSNNGRPSSRSYDEDDYDGDYYNPPRRPSTTRHLRESNGNNNHSRMPFFDEHREQSFDVEESYYDEDGIKRDFPSVVESEVSDVSDSCCSDDDYNTDFNGGRRGKRSFHEIMIGITIVFVMIITVTVISVLPNKLKGKERDFNDGTQTNEQFDITQGGGQTLPGSGGRSDDDRGEDIFFMSSVSPTKAPISYSQQNNDNNNNNFPVIPSTPSPTPAINRDTLSPTTSQPDWKKIFSFKADSSSRSQEYSVSLSSSGWHVGILHTNGISIFEEGYQDNIRVWNKMGLDVDPNTLVQESKTPWLSMMGDDLKVAKIQLGSDGTQFLFDTAFSSEGRLQIFKYANGYWIRRGPTAKYNESPGGKYFGSSVAYATKNMNRLIIGAYGGEQAKVYENDSSRWNKIADSIPVTIDPPPANAGNILQNLLGGGNNDNGNNAAAGGQIPDDWFGASVAISSDGLMVAIASPKYQNKVGRVQVFELSIGSGGGATQQWTQVGQDLLGDGTKNHFGILSMSDDGNRLAVGTPNQGRSQPGQVKIFQLQKVNNVWDDVGTIRGFVPDDNFGQMLSISGDGNFIGIIASKLGRSCIYEYNGIARRWDLFGECLENGDPGDLHLYQSISLSRNGMRFAVSSPRSRVAVYEYGR